ncbi:hypothetical protein HGA64_05285 [Candidatus Falkowbacteria bacterium]|nr:hypothetical protein [Candidatus Falkowbacteria bacterium]
MSNESAAKNGRIDWFLESACWSASRLLLIFASPINSGDLIREYLVTLSDKNEEKIYWSGPLICLAVSDCDGEKLSIEHCMVDSLVIEFTKPYLRKGVVVKLHRLIRGLVMPCRIEL